MGRQNKERILARKRAREAGNNDSNGSDRPKQVSERMRARTERRRAAREPQVELDDLGFPGGDLEAIADDAPDESTSPDPIYVICSGDNNWYEFAVFSRDGYVELPDHMSDYEMDRAEIAGLHYVLAGFSKVGGQGRGMQIIPDLGLEFRQSKIYYSGLENTEGVVFTDFNEATASSPEAYATAEALVRRLVLDERPTDGQATLADAFAGVRSGGTTYL